MLAATPQGKERGPPLLKLEQQTAWEEGSLFSGGLNGGLLLVPAPFCTLPPTHRTEGCWTAGCVSAREAKKPDARQRMTGVRTPGPLCCTAPPPPPGASTLLGTAAQPHRGRQRSGSWGAGEADGPGPRHWTNVTEMSVGAWEKAVDSRAFRRDAGRDSPDI